MDIASGGEDSETSRSTVRSIRALMDTTSLGSSRGRDSATGSRLSLRQLSARLHEAIAYHTGKKYEVLCVCVYVV